MHVLSYLVLFSFSHGCLLLSCLCLVFALLSNYTTNLSLCTNPRSYILSSFENLRGPTIPSSIYAIPRPLIYIPRPPKQEHLLHRSPLPLHPTSLYVKASRDSKSNVPILLAFIRQREALLSIYALHSTDDVNCIISNWIHQLLGRRSTLFNLARQTARFAAPFIPFDSIRRDQRELLPTASCSPNPSVHTPSSLSSSQSCMETSL